MPLILFAAIAPSRQDSARTIPPRLTDELGRTVWVGAEEVERGGEALLGELNDPLRFEVGWLREALSRRRSATPAERLSRARCLALIEPAVGLHSYDFDELALGTSNILVGTVVAANDGLFHGSPETLLLIAVDRWHRRHEEMPPSPLVYVRFQTSLIDIAGITACRPYQMFPRPPAPGDRVLAMSYRGPSLVLDRTPVLYPGHMVMYDGVVDGLPTLMASDRMLEGSVDGLVDLTIADLERRIVQAEQSPDEAARAIALRAAERAEANEELAAAMEAAYAAQTTAEPVPTDECFIGARCRQQLPLVLDLGSRGIMTRDLNRSTTLFDIDADGRPERTAWLSIGSDDAFLCMDLDGNGRIDGAHEFVGASGTLPATAPSGRTDAAAARATTPPARPATSGFEALGLYDQPQHGGNGDGQLDEGDRVWDQLLLWNDANSDGVSEPHELSAIGTSVVVVELRYESVRDWDGSLNRIMARGSFWIPGPRRDLRERELHAMMFRFAGQGRR